MTEPEKVSVSFGFSKKSEKKVLKRTINDEEKKYLEETDYVTSLEDKEVKSSKPKQEKKEIVIPLIKTNNWKTNHLKAANNGLDSQAVQEIMQEASARQESWETRGAVDTDLAIPLLMQNQVPEGFETDDRLDVSLRPDEPEDAVYEDVPIEAFGMAMLKGMGWKEGEGIGKNNKAIKPVEAVLRPKGMGLGADRGQAQDLNKSKQGSVGKQEDSLELRLKKGAHCLIENGVNKDLYGVIEGVDEDNARLMVKLTISGKLVSVSQYNTKLVAADEYQKYSKYINKGAADRYKEKEDKRKEKEEREEQKYAESKHGDKRGREWERSGSRERARDKHGRKKDKRKDREHDEKSSKKRKYDDDRPESSSSYTNGSGSSQRAPPLWLKPNLRVRLVDEHFKKGKYFNTKLVIVDVMDRDHCVCKTEEGKILEDISQTMLETVVPRSDSSYVSIISGKHRGQLAHVLERDKRKYLATLQLLSDRDTVLQLDYDSICEYVGDINEEYDF
ncbi:G-patch domain and KOW motifs-containing protein-like [Mya arenaria]|uniref:G-patch domain and KOW motifs-containing protein-like n=1 Tax=Mya arenaria TaxID=6604 RepID=UPI0022E9954D|nr:G-patch domain and KOW motifs-containing protein-like [Mya arenaria]